MSKIDLHIPVSLGCDPELFLTRFGWIIGSERVIPKEGINIVDNNVVRDGVQLELHPEPRTCRQELAVNITTCFRRLKMYMKESGVSHLSVAFDGLVKVPKRELKSLSKESRMFGCLPSMNIYEKDGMSKKICVDPEVYNKRSAGGHIHLGSFKNNQNVFYARANSALAQPEKLVRLLDILVGNTGVLFDRSVGNIERRKLYGMAGEYRTPSHGIEYRVLSNFWLKNYSMFSMMFGFARLAVQVLGSSDEEEDFASKLIELVNEEDVRDAINNNDWDLAYKNFKKIEEYLISIIPTNHENTMNMRTYEFLDENNIDAFKYFIENYDEVSKKYFIKDSFGHWLNSRIDHGRSYDLGFERLMQAIIDNGKV